MKREIKFRGKVVHNDPMTNPDDGWVYGFYYQDLDKGEIKHYIKSCPMDWEIIPETVGQFTGVYDKNGNEVYEGDIVSFDNLIYRIEWDSNNLSYCMRKGERIWYRIDYSELAMYSVIGNVYDNPELLNK